MVGQRFVALLIMLVPAAIAVLGIKIMRDVFYEYFALQLFQWGYFILGLILFVVPVLFIAGFILHHDRKRNRVQPRFMIREEEDDD